MTRLIVTVLLVGTVFAGGTKKYSLEGRETFERAAILENLSISSDGNVYLARKSSLVTSSEVAIQKCVRLQNGRVLASAGGKIFEVTGEKFTLLYDTKELFVTSFAVKGDTVYAGTVPNGKVFKLDGKSFKHHVTLKSPYVWSLVFIKDSLYAACGTPARVYRIDEKDATVIYEGGEANVLSLCSDGVSIFAGTSGPGKIIRLGEKPYTVEAFEDFEVAFLVVDENNRILAGVNKAGLGSPGEIMFAVQHQPMLVPQGISRMLVEESTGYETGPGEPAVVRNQQSAGQGSAPARSRIMLIDGTKREVIAYFPEAILSGLALDEGQPVFSTLSSGRLFRITTAGTFEILQSVQCNSITSFFVENGRIALASTAAPGGIAAIEPAKCKNGSIVFAPFDTGFISKFGNVTSVVKGDVRVFVRSGNTPLPGADWSDWVEPVKKTGMLKDLPAGRYAQIKVEIFGAESSLQTLSIYYRNQNQRPVITSATVTDVAPVAASGGRPSKFPAHSTVKSISWNAVDPDGDSLIFTVDYRNRNSSVWVPITEAPTTQNSVQWNLELVPDGEYVVRVTASDMQSNVPEEALSNTLESKIITVDNTKPSLDLSTEDGLIKAISSDATSIIVGAEYSVDGGDWVGIIPSDGLYDSKKESFEIPQNAPKGKHVVNFRVYDAQYNSIVKSIVFENK